MRVITGSAGGRRLESPNGGDIVRPTADKVKESIFNIINFDIPAAHVLDMFAGTGQLGIEALSRGAASAVFTDRELSSVQLVKRNLAVCKLEDGATVYNCDYRTYLAQNDGNFDVVFIDPPYKLGIFDEAIIAVKDRINPRGVIVCEHPRDFKIGEYCGFVSRDYNYGTVCITVLRKEGD